MRRLRTERQKSRNNVSPESQEFGNTVTRRLREATISPSLDSTCMLSYGSSILGTK